ARRPGARRRSGTRPRAREGYGPLDLGEATRVQTAIPRAPAQPGRPRLLPRDESVLPRRHASEILVRRHTSRVCTAGRRPEARSACAPSRFPERSTRETRAYGARARNASVLRATA